MRNNEVPTFDELMNPLLKALHELGGSGSVDEIYEKVTESLNLPEKTLTQLHNAETGNTTEIEYRLAWARTYMKKYGLLENSGRGVWAIAASKTHIQEINPREIVRYVRNLDRKQKDTQQRQDEQEIIEAPEEIQSWRATLHALLTKQLDPSAFERLVKRMLRESGFVQVEVTGRTGDGGIDGKGIAIVKLHGGRGTYACFVATLGKRRMHHLCSPRTRCRPRLARGRAAMLMRSK